MIRQAARERCRIYGDVFRAIVQDGWLVRWLQALAQEPSLHRRRRLPAAHMHRGRWRWARWRAAPACTASEGQHCKHGAHGSNGRARLPHVLISLVYGKRSARRVAERRSPRGQEILAGTFCTGVLCAGAAWHAVPGAYKREETSETTTNMLRASALRQRDPTPRWRGLRVRGFEHNSISALQNKPYDQRITNQLFAATGTTSATASVGIATAAMTAVRKRPAKAASLAR